MTTELLKWVLLLWYWELQMVLPSNQLFTLELTCSGMGGGAIGR